MRAADAAPAYRIVSVARLARYLQRRIEEDPKLRQLGVRGEISGLRAMPNGNLYFDLKDGDALVNCLAWSVNANRFPPLTNGQEIVAIGSVTTFPKKSIYQLQVTAVEGGGSGRLHALYEALKRKLDDEGLFAESRKRALPRYPFRVALVSSRSANGASDFLTQAAGRAPHVAIEFFETPVQGGNAAPEIVRALDRASRAAVDIVVIARGGGSYEDLFVFSDERVVRALARCAHPTVSAIGHEADAPLTDFVADHRAATPSSAAQTILPQRTALVATVTTHTKALDRAVRRLLERTQRDLKRIELRSPLWAPDRVLLARRQRVDAAWLDARRILDVRLHARRGRLAALAVRLEACNPSRQLGRRRERLTLVAYRLEASVRGMAQRQRQRFESVRARLEPAVAGGVARRRTAAELLVAKLDGRDPTRILQRGYAIVTVNGVALRDAAAVAPGALVRAQLARGRLDARVEAVRDDGGK